MRAPCRAKSHVRSFRFARDLAKTYEGSGKRAVYVVALEFRFRPQVGVAEHVAAPNRRFGSSSEGSLVRLYTAQTLIIKNCEVCALPIGPSFSLEVAMSAVAGVRQSAAPVSSRFGWGGK